MLTPYYFFLFLLPQEGEGWLTSQNAAGLDVLPQAHISQAEVCASVANGGWCDYWQADESQEWGARTRSLYRVDERIVLAGEVSYRNFTGRHMSGSLLIDPSDQPFDLVEWNEGHAGEKQLEEYLLNGAASYRIGEQWSLGARIDFTSANYAKRRDLRHQNRLMQMRLSPGFTWRASANVRLGANYLFERKVEGISVNVAGTSDTDYYTLISYGAFYGVKQLATSLDGYIVTSGGMTPLVDRRQGGSIQLDWALANDTRWYSEATCTARDGYYGRRSLYSVVYTDHDGLDLHLRTLLSRQTSATTRHQWALEAERHTLDNSENLWNEEQAGGGLSRIVYYAKMQRGQRTTQAVQLTYDVETGIGHDQRPAWHLQAEAGLWTRDIKATFYPAYRKQDIQQWHVSGSASRHFGRKNDALDATLSAIWQWGDGTMAHDGTSGGGQAKTHAVSLDRYLRQEFDYLTAQQWLVHASLRYSRPMPQRHISPYLKVDYGRRQATEANYMSERHHTQIGIAVGCEF